MDLQHMVQHGGPLLPEQEFGLGGCEHRLDAPHDCLASPEASLCYAPREFDSHPDSLPNLV